MAPWIYNPHLCSHLMVTFVLLKTNPQLVFCIWRICLNSSTYISIEHWVNFSISVLSVCFGAEVEQKMEQIEVVSVSTLPPSPKKDIFSITVPKLSFHAPLGANFFSFRHRICISVPEMCLKAGSSKYGFNLVFVFFSCQSKSLNIWQ